MGRGNSSTQEKTLAPPINLEVAAQSQEGEAGEQAAESPCEERREVAISIVGSPTLASGDPVSIRIGAPPRVLRNGEEVGTVAEPDAALIQGCLEIDYRIQGRINSINLPTKSATALIRGTK